MLNKQQDERNTKISHHQFLDAKIASSKLIDTDQQNGGYQRGKGPGEEGEGKGGQIQGDIRRLDFNGEYTI